MRSVNKVIIIGNVTREPQTRTTQNGQLVCTFGVATNRSWKTAGGADHESAEFHEVVAWAKLAEICEKYIHKGKLVYIEGYLKTRNWDTADGTRRFKTEVVIQDLILLDKPERSGEESSFEQEVMDAQPQAEDFSEEEDHLMDNSEPVEQTDQSPARNSSKEENLIDKDLG